jgi:hypothetical protein
VNPYLKSLKEGRIAVVVSKSKEPHSDQISNPSETETLRPSNTIIKVLLDSGSDGDLMLHEKGTPVHISYLTRWVPTS